MAALAVVLLLTLTAGCVAFGLRTADYHPQINPADFQTTAANPYYPLVPGTTLKYTENDKGEVSENEVTVTHDTKMVMGVKCVVVHDVVMRYGRVAEDTYDWLAPQQDGTIWYFGEDTKEISPGGRVSTLGSWEAGISGGQPGILMPGQPQPGTPYRQEYGPGAAEDMGQIVALNETVKVPAGTFTGCVKTKEWSLLESGHEYKWYAKGVGLVKEEATGGAVVMLQSITRP
ncbi:MAG: hypothetical protein AABO58_15160 [Acidobacteriota bacterium]